jgi:cation diffusion facilitator family transporter
MSGSHHHPSDVADPRRYQASRRVTWVSVALNLTLAVAQIVVGVVGNSNALVADGVHTLSDLLTDGIVLVALTHSSKDADEEHPYGHERIETAVTLVLGLMLVGVAIGIAIQAGGRLFDPAPLSAPSPLTLVVAIVTLTAKEWLYRYTLRTAAHYDSSMLKANAWHHRSDAVSSLIVIVGIGGALFGYAYLDAIAAVLVSAMVAKIGIGLGRQALRELIDTGLDADERSAIRDIIQGVNGVRALHLLRTRRVGSRALVDVHILVDRQLSVSEGHQIGEVVRSRLIERIPAVSDVTVHVDSEDDKEGIAHPDLPLRGEMLRRLERYFAHIPEHRQVDRTTLHYVNGRIDVELRLPLTAIRDIAHGRSLAQQFAGAARSDRDIGQIDVYFH